MRKKNGTTTASSNVKEVKTNFPTVDIQPTDVGVIENDTRVEDKLEVLKILIELSGIENLTVEEFLKGHYIKTLTDEDGRKVFLGAGGYEVNPIQVFLDSYYANSKAYIKVGDRVIYGDVIIGDYDDYELHTPKGILKMPSVAVDGTYVFFPHKAILSRDEYSIFELYHRYGGDISERDRLEKLLMETMTKLSLLGNDRSVKETSSFMKDIKDFCQQSGIVEDIAIENGRLYLNFGRRVARDTDGVRNAILPPCQLKVDFQTWTVSGGQQYHPHILEGGRLCLGAVLTEMIGTCVREKDLKGIVGALVQFAGSFTSSDCHFDDWRSPAGCLARYIENAYHGDCPLNLADICQEIGVREMWRRLNNTYWKEDLRKMIREGDEQELKDKLGSERLERAVIHLFQNTDANEMELDRMMEKYHFNS